MYSGKFFVKEIERKIPVLNAQRFDTAQLAADAAFKQFGINWQKLYVVSVVEDHPSIMCGLRIESGPYAGTYCTRDRGHAGGCEPDIKYAKLLDGHNG